MGLYTRDDFTRANSSAMGSTTSGFILPWTEQSGDWAIAANRAYEANGASGYKFMTIPHPKHWDIYSLQMELLSFTQNGAGLGLGWRFGDNDNWWSFFYYRDSTGNPMYFIRKQVANVDADPPGTPVAAPGGHPAMPLTLRVDVTGDNMKAYWNGNLIFDITDSANSGNNKVGLMTVSGATAQVHEYFQMTSPYANAGVSLA